MLQDRIEKKQERKFKNVNFVRHQINQQKNSGTLKDKIRKMRKEKIFPQPKSYTNYSKRNGFLKKNSIKIEN